MAINFTEMFNAVGNGYSIADIFIRDAALLDIVISLGAFFEKQVVNDAYSKVVLNGLKKVFECANKLFDLDYVLSKDESAEFSSLLFQPLNKKPNMRDDMYFVPLEEGAKSVPFTKGFHLTFTEQDLPLAKASIVTLTRAFRLAYQRVLNRFCGTSNPIMWKIENAVEVFENQMKKEVPDGFRTFATELIKNYFVNMNSFKLDLSDVNSVHEQAVEEVRHFRILPMTSHVSRTKETRVIKQKPAPVRYEEPVKKDPTKFVTSVAIFHPNLLKIPTENPWAKKFIVPCSAPLAGRVPIVSVLVSTIVQEELRKRFIATLESIVKTTPLEAVVKTTPLEEVVKTTSVKFVGKPYVKRVVKVKSNVDIDVINDTEEGWTVVKKITHGNKSKVNNKSRSVHY
jgi:hypothetical protein